MDHNDISAMPHPFTATHSSTSISLDRSSPELKASDSFPSPLHSEAPSPLRKTFKAIKGVFGIKSAAAAERIPTPNTLQVMHEGNLYRGQLNEHGIPHGAGNLYIATNANQYGRIEGTFDKGNISEGKFHFHTPLFEELDKVYDGPLMNFQPHGEGGVLEKGEYREATFFNGVEVPFQLKK